MERTENYMESESKIDMQVLRTTYAEEQTLMPHLINFREATARALAPLGSTEAQARTVKGIPVKQKRSDIPDRSKAKGTRCWISWKTGVEPSTGGTLEIPCITPRELNLHQAMFY